MNFCQFLYCTNYPDQGSAYCAFHNPSQPATPAPPAPARVTTPAPTTTCIGSGHAKSGRRGPATQACGRCHTCCKVECAAYAAFHVMGSPNSKAPTPPQVTSKFCKYCSSEAEYTCGMCSACCRSRNARSLHIHVKLNVTWKQPTSFSLDGPSYDPAIQAKELICECGAAKLGIKPLSIGHSSWCPVKVK